MARIARICRFPIKALSAEDLDRIEVSTGATLPFDRRFAFGRIAPGQLGDAGAIMDGQAEWEPSGACEWQPPGNFFTLKRHASLAALTAKFDRASARVQITGPDGAGVEADMETAAGRARISLFVSDFLALPDQSASRPWLMDAGRGRHFADKQTPYISIINQASVDSIPLPDNSLPGQYPTDKPRDNGRPSLTASLINPLRFRGNLLVDGWKPWEEESLPGKCLTVGSVRLRVIEPIGRCVATHVDPNSAHRDRNLLKTLQANFGHTNCGVYAVIEKGGTLSAGDTITY